ncbi:MAG: hypothetical protein HC802_00480 [Caldilineaceae bacterium]|nr:hypothetical protein [Caldilineaceae bacterium]
MDLTRETLTVAFCGPVGSGKSTLLGNFRFLTGGFDQRSLDRKFGGGEVNYAWVMDNTAEEEAAGRTLRWSSCFVETEKYLLNCVQVPESVDLLRETISGLSQADVACLVVDPHPDRFEAAIAPGGEIMRTSIILATLGINQLIVAVNKMDTVSYSETRFNDVVAQLKPVLQECGHNLNLVRFFPTVATKGENVIGSSTNMPWCKGTLAWTLLSAIDTIDSAQLPVKNASAPFRGLVVREDNQYADGTDWLVVHVEAGVLRRDQEVVFYPTHTVANPCAAKIRQIDFRHEAVSDAGPGATVVLEHSGLSKTHWPRRGDVMVIKGDTSLGPVTRFTARISVVYQDGPLAVGAVTTLYLNSAQVQVRIAKIEREFNRKTGATIAENPASIGQATGAVVVFEPLEPLTLAVFQKTCQGLGRLVLTDSKLSAAGVMNLSIGAVSNVVYG